ncbi:MAG: MerR family transcriptional regulator [Bacillota bacterium]|nr:MerR family transcriptional regulator [Bacillota bacterium]
MELRNCIRCGKLFAYVNKPICPECVRKEEEDFERVRRYLRENPRATVMEVAEATEVDQHLIQQWLREGRLISTEFHLMTECERCGRPIPGGRYCKQCAEELGRELQGSARPAPAAPEPEPGKIKQTGRMYTAERMLGERERIPLNPEKKSADKDRSSKEG